ncbi:MAG: hypothetical protein M3P18_04340, partial [Actinomycetota bacterium]|nr:hypothetical protein [Actinomycetota bacterium]
GIDLFGIDPYPCRSELDGCNYSMVGRYVSAAVSAGIPRANIVPVFHAFGGGAWSDDGDGSYLLPTAEQAARLLNTWARQVPTDGGGGADRSTCPATVWAATCVRR